MIYDSMPWIKSYDTGVNYDIEIPNLTLVEYMVDSFKKHSSQIAFHYFDMDMTFDELLEYSGRFATYLSSVGVGKNDVVAIHLPNCPQYLIAIAGALRAGCGVSGVSPLLMPDELKFQINNCNAKVIVTLDVLYNDKFKSVLDEMPGLKEVLATGIFDSLESIQDYPSSQTADGMTIGSFWEILEITENAAPVVNLTQDDPCYIQYTGGTTGPPKGAILTHGNIVSNLSQFENWFQLEHGTELFLSGFPMFHLAGLFISTAAICCGFTQILIPDPRNIEHIIKEIKVHRPTFLANVPSLYFMLLDNPEFQKLDFSHLSYCFSGAAPFPVEKINELERVVGKNKLVEVWGMTETGPLISVNPAKNEKKIGSVGLPLPKTKLRVVDLEEGINDVTIGEEGELICSGPQVMKGYLNLPDETAKAIREIDGEKWMYTGDIGRMDEDGFIHLVDRAKDMLIVGGFKVFSSDVEDKLYKHPAVSMCAIVGVHNSERPDSEIVKVVIQKSEKYKDTPDDEIVADIKAFAKKILAPYKIPKIFEFIEEIPVTSVGKIDKKSMRN